MERPLTIERNRSFAQTIRDNWNHDGGCVCLPLGQSGETDEQRKRR
jgi:hypothetical protein